LKFTPLHLAAEEGHIEIVKFLTMEKHCDPMSRNIHNNTALHCAVLNGHMQVVKFFIEELKLPWDILGQHNTTSLQMAIIRRHPNIVQYLRQWSDILTAIAMMKQLGL